jgi:hypothetical protein
MTDRQIIEEALWFLVENYGFNYNYECVNNGAIYFRYHNQYGSFTYYRWAQFQEEEFFVKYNEFYRSVDFSSLHPKEFYSFIKMHKGIRWFFKDKRKDYWNMIAQFIKVEIENTKTLFGIKLE